MRNVVLQSNLFDLLKQQSARLVFRLGFTFEFLWNFLNVILHKFLIFLQLAIHTLIIL